MKHEILEKNIGLMALVMILEMCIRDRAAFGATSLRSAKKGSPWSCDRWRLKRSLAQIKEFVGLLVGRCDTESHIYKEGPATLIGSPVRLSLIHI